tara:strand:- start:1458 stop:2177 length:720 start_codon:yes stop_codon:yes gene_type:complete
MASTQGKKIFRVHLSISIVLLLLTLGTLSLFAAFYLGMITGKSMQRPPEKSISENEFNLEKPMSEDDLKFFGLGEREKDQDFLDLEGIKALKNKTEELSQINDLNEKKSKKLTNISKPNITNPESPDVSQKNLENKKPNLSKVIKPKNPESEILTPLQNTNAVLYTIQVFASRNHKNAKNLVDKLNKDGFSNAFIFKHSAGNKTLYRVRVGKINRKDAKIMANKLKKLKYIDSVQLSRF